jgi:ABC-type transporter lipoprotein component MlaA
MKGRSLVGLGLVCALLLACASDEAPPKLHNLTMMGADEHRQQTTGDSYELVQYVNDPIEGFNRGSFGFTKGLVDWFVRPLAIGWRAITPRPVRTGLDNFAYNLAFPDRFVSLLLQGRPVRAGIETGNFLVNSTVGIAGFLDVAKPLGIPTYKEDVGQAFGRWGFGPGFYLFIPVLGPSTGRDGVGRIFDTALSPATYIPGVGLLFTVNAFSSRVRTYDMLNESGTDLYLPLRTLWAINRDIQVSDYEIPESAWNNADPNPSLGILLTKLADAGFPRLAERGEVAIAATGGKLPYSLWLQGKPAPLVFIIPGIGSHRSTTNAVKLAESAYKSGYSAVIVSSPFHPEFILNGLSATYPGYTPSDAEDLYRALSAIRADLETRHPRSVTSTSLMGYSLGGIATLFVSQIERKAADPGALHFERVVAINPAVDLGYASERFDAYFDAPLSWPEDARRDRGLGVVKKAYKLIHGDEAGRIAERGTLPFERSESDFLIGLSSRATTIQAIAASHSRGGKELSLVQESVVGLHGPFALAIGSNTLKRYMDELAIPYFAERVGKESSTEQLFATANLYSQEAGLRDDPRIRVFTNRDDFILATRDLSWLESTFGGRLTVFPGGGHLGNMYMPQVQDAFVNALGVPPGVAGAR